MLQSVKLAKYQQLLNDKYGLIWLIQNEGIGFLFMLIYRIICFIPQIG